ncbi:MAG: methyltransferase, partial [Nanoarchaeota archaeon]|nr:methyltransferase [Nanoarchaeota archaeon]
MPEHYYSKNQTSELRITEIEVRLRGNILKLHTGSGVFAIGKVDKGTELLIDECIINENSDILDLGCGYGVV